MVLAAVITAAFLLGACSTIASTKALLSIERRDPWGSANWGLLVNCLQGGALLLVVFTDTVPALIADAAGCYLAEYLVVRLSPQPSSRKNQRSGEQPEGE